MLLGHAAALHQLRKARGRQALSAAKALFDKDGRLVGAAFVGPNAGELVAEIRAILLAAVRSAVLWRQLGGSYLDFLLSRKAMLEAAEEWLR